MEEQHKGCDIRDIREVETAPALAATQRLQWCRANTLHPLLIKYPGALGIHPKIEILCQHIAHRFGSVLRVLDLVGKVLGRDRYSEVGIGLDPHLRVFPLLLRVLGVDDAEQAVIDIYATQHLDDIVAVGIADTRLVEACGGNDEHKRLSPCAKCRLKDIEHAAIFVRMKLIDDGTRGRETIVCTIVRGEWLHRAALQLVGNGVAIRSEIVLEVCCLDNSHRIREAELRLVFDRSGRIDLWARLAIGKEHQQSRTRGEHRLAVLTRDLDVGIAKPACAVSVHPAKDVPDDKLLPGLKFETLTRPHALGVLELLDEVDGTSSRLAVEVPPSIESNIEVIVVPLHRQAHILAHQHLARYYLLGVLLGCMYLCLTHLSLQILRIHLFARCHSVLPTLGCGSMESCQTPQPATWRQRELPRQPCASG